MVKRKSEFSCSVGVWAWWAGSWEVMACEAGVRPVITNPHRHYAAHAAGTHPAGEREGEQVLTIREALRADHQASLACKYLNYRLLNYYY